jgi:hypothetical protein
MNDTLKRGYLFDGVSGEKSGANLEDLVTRVNLTSGSQLVDQVTIEDYEDGDVLDDDGNAIRRARVKDGSITAAKLSTTAIWGPELMVSIFGSAALAAAAAVLQGTWGTAPTTLANIFDGSIATDWGEAKVNASGWAGYKWDLGAIYRGHLLYVAQCKTSGYLRPAASATISSTTLTNSNVSENEATWQSTGYVEMVHLIPFWGRYVYITFLSTSTAASYVKLERFEAYGAVAP